MQLDLNQICELLAALDRTEISELSLKSADFELTVRKGIAASDRVLSGEPTSASPAGTLAPDAALSSPQPVALPVADTARQVSASPPSADSNQYHKINSPMVGTFYRAPAPGEPAFVEVSDRVQAGQTVCIIEAMKLMNEIEAEVSGRVVEILVENGNPVEFGHLLILIDPD